MYLGGCGLYAEVEFADESTMCCRREGVFDMRGETPDHLLGVAYTHSGFQTGAPYRVLDDSHWVFSGTKLRNGDLFGHRRSHNPAKLSRRQLFDAPSFVPAISPGFILGERPPDRFGRITEGRIVCIDFDRSDD